ncbi:DUF2834 domain-containing protein [Mycobacteroides chelonae]|uniref:DUF2834 domain-containing protein n=1 Tax=Mycobacteroides TaxID=670516 RepID=UPI00091D9B8C|nr:DUF2834 domain-containing protein [Mycobacteroides chelonae]OHU12111.1 hypothetical protein BKG75_21380 [Mycobacteroides chelonae]
MWDHTTATPQGRLETLGNEAHHVADSLGGYLRENLGQGTAGAAAAPTGGEAAPFQAWAFSEARRLGILRWWAASVLVTFGVGAGTAVPFFLLVRDAAAARSHPRR